MNKNNNTMVYLHFFETEQEFEQAYNGQEYDEPWVSYTEDEDRVDYDKPVVAPSL